VIRSVRARQRLLRAQARLRGETLHRGGAVECPCCGGRFAEFAPLVADDRMCWRCGSLERHRLLAIWLARNPELLEGAHEILHVAPEPALRPLLEAAARRYVSGDLGREFGELALDVTALPFDDASFDAIVCNHVLEHVVDDRTAMGELRRVLRSGGWALLLVPDAEAGHTDEDPAVTDPVERAVRFGQHDHVRRYGLDYLERLSAAGFHPERIDLGPQLTEEETERMRLRKFGALEPIFLAWASGSRR